MQGVEADGDSAAAEDTVQPYPFRWEMLLGNLPPGQRSRTRWRAEQNMRKGNAGWLVAMEDFGLIKVAFGERGEGRRRDASETGSAGSIRLQRTRD
ncbi:hypothetical protein BM1_07258 [Bipolaris maydis]|nr:hypothetical protein BM1_07258 [Bipolaris maydis]